MSNELTATPASESFKLYRLPEEGWPLYQAGLLKRMGYIAGFIFLATLLYSVFGISGQWYQWLVFLPVSIGVGISILISYRHQRDSWNSLQVKLGQNFIIIGHNPNDEVRVMRSEIAKIEEYKFGILISTDKNRQLIVPRELAPLDFQEIKRVLSKWKFIDLKFEK